MLGAIKFQAVMIAQILSDPFMAPSGLVIPFRTQKPTTLVPSLRPEPSPFKKLQPRPEPSPFKTSKSLNL